MVYFLPRMCSNLFEGPFKYSQWLQNRLDSSLLLVGSFPISSILIVINTSGPLEKTSPRFKTGLFSTA